jgi:serine protease
MPIRRPLLLSSLVLAVLTAPTGAAASEYVPGEVIVRYDDHTRPTAEAAVERVTGAQTEEGLPSGTEKLEIEDGDSVRETITELRQDPNVEYAVPNWKARAAAFTPNDPDIRLQWNLFGEFGVGMPEAWELATARRAPGGRGAVVAVLDSGVAFERFQRFRRAPDLRARTFVKGYDFLDVDRHPNDEHGHGTHIAGTIAQATNNARGVAGIAYGAKIMPLRVLDSRGEGDSFTIARAIRYAARKRVDVINLSLDFVPGVRAAQVPDVHSALNFARRRGAVITAAAGNRRDFDPPQPVAYPARARAVIAVGATTRTGCQADYSNLGQELDVVAPGGGTDAGYMRSPWDAAHCRPNAPGTPIFQQTFTHKGLVSRFGLRGTWSPREKFEGTSMATSHVSAIAALVIASGRLGPNPSPGLVERHLEATARDAGATGFDRLYGHGIVDAAAALR